MTNKISESSPALYLTQTVQKGGCAAKVAALELRKILSDVRFPSCPPELMVDGSTFDDAAIYKINDDLALVQTLDFFTPIVDSPYRFGQIAAANALSDVYAMGGQPKTAMAIMAFPLATMASQVATEVLQGASDIIAQAKAAFVGGHTIDDETLKFGLSVTGFVNPSRLWTNGGAQAGDVLILTKALGTGTLTAALKRRAVSEKEIEEALASMCRLNNVAEYLNTKSLSAIHGATDITGFGLAGHCLNMAKASEMKFKIRLKDLPRFPQTLEFLEAGFLTKAHHSNRNYTENHTVWSEAYPKPQQDLVFDPQTSGGLLLAVNPSQAMDVLQALQGAFPHSRIIGEVETPRHSHELLEFI